MEEELLMKLIEDYLTFIQTNSLMKKLLEKKSTSWLIVIYLISFLMMQEIKINNQWKNKINQDGTK